MLALTDVDDAGLADDMIMYYDAGTQTFKFKLEAGVSIAACTDVTLTGLATGEILKYNGTKFVNVANLLSLLTDVSVGGIAVGQGIKWDGTDFVPFSPKLTLESLDDTDIDDTTTLSGGDRLQYISATKWTNIPMPTWSALASYQAGYTEGSAGFFDSKSTYDPMTGVVTLRGVVSNANGAVGAPVWIASVTTDHIPDATVPFRCTVGIGATNVIAIGEVAITTGRITIYSYYASATGILTAGIPAGDISLDGVSYYRNA